jgi:hypothetical protein
MKVLTPGHLYDLDNFENNNMSQRIQFIEKDAGMTTINDGTTNEEVLTMLINRLKFLGERLPSRENSIAVTRCEEALLWLNKRTEDRRARGVEGTSKP